MRHCWLASRSTGPRAVQVVVTTRLARASSAFTFSVPISTGSPSGLPVRSSTGTATNRAMKSGVPEPRL